MAVEEITTLNPGFNRQHVIKLLRDISRLRESGKTEVQIVKAIKTDWKHLDGHTLRRLHEMSLGTPIVDDFVSSIVKGSRLLNDGGMQVDVTESPQDVGVGSLVQFNGDPWCVMRIEKKTSYILRRVR